MLSVGDVVKVQVIHTANFGIFCRYGEEKMLVKIPQVSWIASFGSCKQFAEPGDTLTVKIGGIDIESGRIVATIKGLHPDPWQTDQLQVGANHTARVIRYVEEADRCNYRPAYLIELLPGAYTMLCANGSSLESGENVDVTIRAIDRDRHYVSVELPREGK